MNSKTELTLSHLIDTLDLAVMNGETEKADEIAAILFRLQGGTEDAAVMPAQFPIDIAARNRTHSGGRTVKPKSIKRLISIAAAAALIMALGITALATHLFGLRDMVIGGDTDASNVSGAAAPVSDETALHGSDSEPTDQNVDLIAMQGYPDSNEYKASEAWNIFCKNYDTDHSILNIVGNNPNEYTEKYPMYLVYSQEMAEKLEEIIAKYRLTLHTSITIAENAEELIRLAQVGKFLGKASGGGVNTVYSGYVYNDRTFHYDGQAVLANSSVIEYQFGNYVKGTFSEPCLNIGNADTYQQWQYTTKSGVKVSLALSETKSLVITDRENSFVIVNVLAGTGDSGFGSSSITAEDLQSFADMFDFTQIS